MNVHIVHSWDGAGVSEILGVYATREAAARAKRERSNYEQYDAHTVDDHDPDSCDSAAWMARCLALDWHRAGISEHEVESAPEGDAE